MRQMGLDFCCTTLLFLWWTVWLRSLLVANLLIANVDRVWWKLPVTSSTYLMISYPMAWLLRMVRSTTLVFFRPSTYFCCPIPIPRLIASSMLGRQPTISSSQLVKRKRWIRNSTICLTQISLEMQEPASVQKKHGSHKQYARYWLGR